MPAVCDHGDAVDEDVGDTGRIALGIVVSAGVDNGRRIENHQVGIAEEGSRSVR